MLWARILNRYQSPASTVGLYALSLVHTCSIVLVIFIETLMTLVPYLFVGQLRTCVLCFSFRSSHRASELAYAEQLNASSYTSSFIDPPSPADHLT